MKHLSNTGLNGFLGSRIRINPDYFYHFGAPSCKEKFISKENLYNKIFLSTCEIIDYCRLHNKKLIYTSSMGIYEAKSNPETLQDYYNYYKLVTDMLVQTLDNYLILRIPRVYGLDCNKGLLNPNNSNFDYNKILEYLDINDFISQTNTIQDTTGIYYYKNTRKESIKKILSRYTI